MPIVRSLLFLFVITAVGCDPPSTPPADESVKSTPEQYYSGYYASIPADTTGDDLKARLHELIDDHEPLSYRELWVALAVTDPDPNNPDHVRLSIVMPGDEIRRLKLREAASRLAADLLRDHGCRITIDAAPTWDGQAT